jgi:hypothetical protein
MTQSTGQNAKWNTPVGMLHSRTQDVADYVLIGRNDSGQPIIFGSGDETQARKLLQNSGLTEGSREGASFGG